MATKLTDLKNITRLLFNEGFINIDYFFTTAAAESHANKSHKVIIEMSFTHPLTGEQVDLRVMKSALILCQPTEVIEAVVQREAKEFLNLFPQGLEDKAAATSSSILKIA